MRTDPTGLVLGLLFLLIAGLGLASSFTALDVGRLGVGLPLCLIVIGVIGLHGARRT